MRKYKQISRQSDRGSKSYESFSVSRDNSQNRKEITTNVKPTLPNGKVSRFTDYDPKLVQPVIIQPQRPQEDQLVIKKSPNPVSINSRRSQKRRISYKEYEQKFYRSRKSKSISKPKRNFSSRNKLNMRKRVRQSKSKSRSQETGFKTHTQIFNEKIEADRKKLRKQHEQFLQDYSQKLNQDKHDLSSHLQRLEISDKQDCANDNQEFVQTIYDKVSFQKIKRCFPAEPWKKCLALNPAEYIPNLQVFEFPSLSEVRKVQSFFHGWTVLITGEDVTFLGPDFKTFTTYESSNVICACEFMEDLNSNKNNGEPNINHEVVLISPNLIEIFKCENYKYNFMIRARGISIEPQWIAFAQTFHQKQEFAFVTDTKMQEIHIYNWKTESEINSKKIVLEKSAKDAKLLNNDIIKLSYSGKILIAQTERNYFYFYSRYDDQSSQYEVKFRELHRFIEFKAQVYTIQVEDIQVISKRYILIVDKEDLNLYIFKIIYQDEDDKNFNSKFIKVQYLKKVQYSFNLFNQKGIELNPKRIKIDDFNKTILISDKEDTYYISFDDFYNAKIEIMNIGFESRNENVICMLKDAEKRIILAHSENLLMNWNIFS
eukprot:403361343